MLSLEAIEIRWHKTPPRPESTLTPQASQQVARGYQRYLETAGRRWIEPDTLNHHRQQQRKTAMPIMPPQDDRDDLDCQEALEVEFQAHAGVALLQLLEDAKSIDWPEAEARRAIMRLIEVHLNSERQA